jgi:hypothetical protein
VSERLIAVRDRFLGESVALKVKLRNISYSESSVRAAESILLTALSNKGISEEGTRIVTLENLTIVEPVSFSSHCSYLGNKALVTLQLSNEQSKLHTPSNTFEHLRTPLTFALEFDVVVTDVALRLINEPQSDNPKNYTESFEYSLNKSDLPVALRPKEEYHGLATLDSVPHPTKNTQDILKFHQIWAQFLITYHIGNRQKRFQRFQRFQLLTFAQDVFQLDIQSFQTVPIELPRFMDFLVVLEASKSVVKLYEGFSIDLRITNVGAQEHELKLEIEAGAYPIYSHLTRRQVLGVSKDDKKDNPLRFLDNVNDQLGFVTRPHRLEVVSTALHASARG